MKNICRTLTSMLVADLNVTNVTIKKFNDVILNHFNNVNASIFNVISVIVKNPT